MQKFTCKADFSDMDDFFEQCKQEVINAMSEVGARAVDFAKANGNYQDRTGYLRSRNQYDVNEQKLTLYNDAEYAPYVEAKGFDVISGAALFAERELKKTFRR